MSDMPSQSMKQSSRLGDDFRTRVVSGIVMLVVALGATWLGGWAFAALLLAGGVVLLVEWTNMTRGGERDSTFTTAIVTLALMVLAFMLQPDWIPLVPLWLVIGIIGVITMIALNRSNDRSTNLATFGFDYIALPVIAILWLRNDTQTGLLVVLFLFAIVWGTDIMGYVCGRYFGGPKLWPAVSPKKTWSGAIGGTVAAIVAGILVGLFHPEASWLRLGLVAFCLSILSQCGDIFESAMKRHYNMKDSGRIIPGHGGLLDRVDGLLFAALGAAIFALAAGPWDQPARTILVGGS